MADYDLAIIGAGIVGSALAACLSPHARTLLLDRDVRGLPGSTGHAPGFVGQLNQLLPLTVLAQRTVEAYRAIPGGFDVVGGLEVARSAADLPALEERAQLARARGLRAEIVDGSAAHALAPAFVSPGAAGALHFPDDGTANARVLAHAYQDAAAAAGATLMDADVTAIDDAPDGKRLTTSAGTFTARRVAVCTGVWSAQLLPLPAAVAVAHPYAYSAARAAREKSPFVRWPTAHVYARDHGAADGIGSYDHDPVHVSARAVGAHTTATGAWDRAFDDVMERAIGLLPAATAAGFAGRTAAGEGKGDEGGAAADAAYAAMIAGREAGTPHAFNGLFQVTPDGMPLVGRVREGVYAAVGVWVTQGAGCAGLLADMMLEDMGRGEGKDAELRAALDPLRFGDDARVVEAALRTYNDIYNKEK